MPARRSRRVTHRKRGGSIRNWIRKAHDYLKKNKTISTVGSKFSHMHPRIKMGVNFAKRMGYGRRPRPSHRIGGATRLAGGRHCGGRLY
jgi:hypothetical protein